MNAQDVADQIQTLTSVEFVEARSAALVATWTEGGLGIEAVEPILRFMEARADLEYGSPGALVHFMERFHGSGYESEVLASVERHPTPHTVWLLNRLLNGAKTLDLRSAYIAALQRARTHAAADEVTRREIDQFLARQE